MPVPVWRNSVPHVSDQPSWAVERPWNAAVATEFEEGPDRLRKRGGPAVISWGRALSPEEFVEFEDMIRVDFAEGTSRFTMPVQRPGRGELAKQCQIIGATYSASAEGLSTRVSMKLKIYDYYS